MLTLCLKRSEVRLIERQMAPQRARLAEFFSEPMILDLGEVAAHDTQLDMTGLLASLRRLDIVIAGVCNGSEQQLATARAAGVPVISGSSGSRRSGASEAAASEAKTRVAEARPAQTAPIVSPQQQASTHIVDAPVRTGQRVFASGDVTLLASVNPGAEVLAAGSIHVYGPLRGGALAGINGDRKARFFTRSMEAELVSIAGCFRVLENDLGKEIQGKPAQVFLDGERIVITALR